MKKLLNKELLKKVRDAVADECNYYNQAVIFDHEWQFTMEPGQVPEEGREDFCGSPGCIAGWTLALSGLSADEIWEIYWSQHALDKAANLLGLPEEISHPLFSAEWFGLDEGEDSVYTRRPSRKQAVAALERLLEQEPDFAAKKCMHEFSDRLFNEVMASA